MELCFRRLALQRELLSWENSQPKETSETLSVKHGLEIREVIEVAQNLGYNLDMAPEKVKDWPRIGRYQVIRPLGEGGMGFVYLAFDPKLNRQVAIKVLREDIPSASGTDTQAAKTRLYREAQAMAQVSSHQNIVNIYDVGKHGKQIYIAMEFVDGCTLKEWTHKNASNWEDVRDMYIEASKGLHAAHQANLVHRDFKPDNCLVNKDGIVKVMDFGLARREGKSPTGMTMMFKSGEGIDQFKVDLTQTGVVQGTPAYMAPEQFNQDSTTAKTDQFAFCVALFEAFAGYRPFQASDYDTLQLKVTKGEIVDSPTKSPVPSWVWEAILKGLSRFPDSRWSSMQDLAGALVDPPPHLQLLRRTRLKRLGGISLVASMACGYAYHTEIGAYFRETGAVAAPHIKNEKPRGIRLSARSTLSKDEIHLAIGMQGFRIANCFKIWRQHKASSIEDRESTLRVRILFDVHYGNPENFRILEKYPQTTVPNAATSVGACIIGTAGQIWEFPKRLDDVTVSYPFISFP